MKFAVVAVFAAGLAQVGASPLRLMFISPAGQEDPSAAATARVANIGAVRFGHPVPPMPIGVQIITPIAPGAEHHHIHPGGPGRARPIRRPCGGMRMSRFRQKSIEISNAIRHALGMPLIPQPGPPMNYLEKGHFAPGHEGYKALPYPHFSNHDQSRPFMARLHYSLMNLGPWEGRAVAFVLGCGIGVLLRMIWVLFIVGYRAIKGPKPEEYTEVIFIEDEEGIAPPSYPVDQKVAIEESK